MRILVFFDLPVKTAAERKAYSQFHKFLINEGYIMLQESVYSKLAINQSTANLCISKIKKNNPKNGLVQVLRITEKQYSSIENISGTSTFVQLDSTERLVIL